MYTSCFFFFFSLTKNILIWTGERNHQNFHDESGVNEIWKRSCLLLMEKHWISFLSVQVSRKTPHRIIKKIRFPHYLERIHWWFPFGSYIIRSRWPRDEDWDWVERHSPHGQGINGSTFSDTPLAYKDNTKG